MSKRLAQACCKYVFFWNELFNTISKYISIPTKNTDLWSPFLQKPAVVYSQNSLLTLLRVVIIKINCCIQSLQTLYG